jgi:hypothetical protein
MGSKIVFFFLLHHKGTSKRSIENRNHTYVYKQLAKGYQNHHHMTFFGYFKGITAAIRNGNKRSCVYHDRGSQKLS